MKYMGMPWGMWTLFAGSFQAQLTDVLGYNEQTAKAITRRAKAKYKEILSRLPEFEKGDRFKINLVGCAMLGAFVLTMPERPNVDRQRLRCPVYQVRYLRFDAGAGAVRFDSCAVPSGLHHERSGRHGGFYAAVYPCHRRAVLRLRL